MDMEERDSREEEEKLSRSEEEKIEKTIRSMTEDIEVPESLKPENVEQMLAGKRHAGKKRIRWKYAAGAAAACICLIVGIAAGYGAFYTDRQDRQSTGASVTAETEKTPQKDDRADIEGLVGAGDYDEIYSYIRADSQKFKWNSENFGAIMEDSAALAAPGSDMAMKEESSGDYSDTNVREEGVGEGDIVKTDGKYLYVMSQQKINIVGIEAAGMEKTAEIIPNGEGVFSELYVEGDLLAAVYSTQCYAIAEDSAGQSGTERDGNSVSVLVYDVSDHADPRQIGTFTQSGYYNTMRIHNGYVYLISNFYAGMPAEPTDRTAYIPRVQGELVEAGDIYIPAADSGSEYTLISAFPLDNPDKETDSAAVLGNSGLCYVSEENIYVTEGIYDGSGGVTQTSIRRLSYSDGEIAAEAQTKVEGTLKDSFCIDEYEGYLRLVTTVSPVYITGGGVQPMTGTEEIQNSSAEEDTNSLYVLDENLETVGEIRDLAPDESVYSARFMGDAGYFVTFRQIDPLFSVDLSDPENPKVIGELKIPGFSEYLHPYGDGRLLGIGMAVDEEAITTDGVKLSMFDISDPTDVQEMTIYVIENTYGTDVASNYKAAFVDTEKNLFGFTAWAENKNSYYIFTFDEAEGFHKVFERELSDWGETRGLYAGDRFYLICGSSVESYTLDGFEKIDDLVL